MGLGELIFMLVLFVLSGFFSGSETALTSLSMVRAEAFLKEGRSGSRALCLLKANTNRMLIAILIGNNLVNIAASAMATVVATEVFGHFGPGLAVGVLTLLILIFGEITPKTFAARYAGRISLLVAPPLLWFTRLALPLVWILERLTIYLQSLTKTSTDPTVTESELISLAEHGAQEGTIERCDKEMIERIFAFNNLRAKDVMIPKQRVVTLDGARTINDAMPEIMAHPYTRIPLYSDNPGDITRVISLRDIFSEVLQGHKKKHLKNIRHEHPLFAPVNQPVEQLFPTLRHDERRLVVVVDEYGEMQGLFTLEDMLEELVGEIHDEMDTTDHTIEKVKQGEIVVDGTEELRMVADHLDVYVTGKPTDSVNHWILAHVQHIPKAGERCHIDGLDVVVEKASRRRIRKVRLTCPVKAESVGKESDSSDN
jgi:putative hemolysin